MLSQQKLTVMTTQVLATIMLAQETSKQTSNDKSIVMKMQLCLQAANQP